MLCCLVLAFFCCDCSTSQKSVRNHQKVSPYEFGLREAKTDIDRYNVLLATHITAIERGVDVDYSGIKSLNIEIPNRESSIPLGSNTDFKGCVFNVRNNVGNISLFSKVSLARDIELTKEMVDGGEYFCVAPLRRGRYLMILEDKTPWVNNREGHNYPAYRKDVILVQDGKAQTETIMPYNTPQTQLQCSYIPITESSIDIQNVIINRTKDSKSKTCCFRIRGLYNVHMESITVNTPDETGLWGDGVFRVEDCVDVFFSKIVINGTYSLKDKYGYGFDLNNVNGFHLSDSFGHGNWGIFGTNNIQRLKVNNSDLNRVDIHLYGRDVSILDCKLSDGYNQFSGVYGDILLERCSFERFTPIINGTSYNSYVPYNLHFIDCVWTVTESNSSFITIGFLKDEINSREELSKKQWPNINVDKLTVNIQGDVKSINLIQLGSGVTHKQPVGYISEILLKHVIFKYLDKEKESTSLVICNKPVLVEKDLLCILEDVHIINDGKGIIEQAHTKYSYPGSVIYNLHSAAKEKFRVVNSSVGYDVNSCYEYDLEYENCTLAYVRCTPWDIKQYSQCRRVYKNCRIYLNNADSEKYYIDNLARYDKCEFIPCSNMGIDFLGKIIDVSFSDCFVKGNVGKRSLFNNAERINGHYDGNNWFL